MERERETEKPKHTIFVINIIALYKGDKFYIL